MILFNDVVKVFHLTDLDASLTILVSWLRVSGTAKMPQIDQSIYDQLHTVVAQLFELKAQQKPFEVGRGSESAVCGLQRRAESAGPRGPDFGSNGFLCGRRPASPHQTRRGCSGPRPSSVSQCGWPWPVINSRGLLPLRSASRLRMKHRWFKKN